MTKVQVIGAALLAVSVLVLVGCGGDPVAKVVKETTTTELRCPPGEEVRVVPPDEQVCRVYATTTTTTTPATARDHWGDESWTKAMAIIDVLQPVMARGATAFRALDLTDIKSACREMGMVSIEMVALNARAPQPWLNMQTELAAASTACLSGEYDSFGPHLRAMAIHVSELSALA